MQFHATYSLHIMQEGYGFKFEKFTKISKSSNSSDELAKYSISISNIVKPIENDALYYQ